MTHSARRTGEARTFFTKPVSSVIFGVVDTSQDDMITIFMMMTMLVVLLKNKESWVDRNANSLSTSTKENADSVHRVAHGYGGVNETP
jgi:hypothetical protein